MPDTPPADRPLFSGAPPDADPQQFLRSGRNPAVGTSRRVGTVPTDDPGSCGGPAIGGPMVSGSASGGEPPLGASPPGPAVPASHGSTGNPGGGAAPAGTPGKAAKAGPSAVVVGVVDGRLTVENVRFAATGAWVLGAVVAVSLVVAVVLALRPGRSGLVMSLVLPLVVIVALLGTTLWRPRERAADEPGGEQIRRFRVRSVTGEVVSCVLRGRLTGDEVRHGDMVRASGRGARDGHIEVRHVDVLSSPTGPVVSRVSARLSAHAVLALWGNRVCYAFAALVAIWVALAATGLVG